MHVLTAALLIPLTCGEGLAQYATILLYHRFEDDRYPTTSVSLKDLEQHMRYLKENGYKVVPLSRIVSWVRDGIPIPPKTVAIAVDDGYRSVMKAFPLFKRYGFPFTVFLYMEAVGRYPDFLTLEDIRTLQESGLVEFGNHSYSHAPFGMMRSTERFLEDLERSEERFLQIFGRRPKLYALPYGFYNRKVLDILRSRGYEAVFTQDPGNVGPFTDLYRMPRQAIVGPWVRMENFTKKLRREPLPLKALHPPYGFLKDPDLTRIGAALQHPERYTSCRIYVTELGWRRAKRNGSFVFRTVEEPLKRRWNRIGVKCRNRETGRWAETFWSVIVR